MPKIYYRCCKCHNKVNYIVIENRPNDGFGYCSVHGRIRIYKYQNNYWWELLYISLRQLVRDIRSKRNANINSRR